MKKIYCSVLLFLTVFTAYTKDNGAIPAAMNGAAGKSLAFIENKGQVTDQYGRQRADIDYKLEGAGVVMFAGSDALHYQWNRNSGNPNSEILNPKQALNSKSQILNSRTETYRLDVELLGANKNAQVIAEDKQAYYENYYLPATPNGATAYSYKKITYKNVYPNIDWVLYVSANSKSEISNSKGVKYDFVIHPGGNPADIRIEYKGATKLEIKDGALTATTPYGSITEDAPYSYWSESKEAVETKFVLNGTILSYNLSENSKFQIPGSKTLIIDPSLKWATYYGGSGQEGDKCGVTADTAGNAYLCGSSNSAANIATTGAFQTNLSGGLDGIVVKMDINGIRQWATYYGGSDDELFRDIAAEPGGTVYIVGDTKSAGLGTGGIHQPAITGSPAGNIEAIILKLIS